MKQQKPASRTLHGLVAEMADQDGAREVLVDDQRRLTYQQLRAEADQVACGMRAAGICPGDRVAILMGNRAEWVVCAIAASTLGATVVAVNTWWTPREIEYALDHSEARLLVCATQYIRRNYADDIESMRQQGKLAALVAIVGVGSGLPGSWIAWDDLHGTHGNPADAPQRESAPEDVAFILYTSGSTSQPKGVQLLQGDLIDNTWHIGERQNMTRDDRLWLAVSLFWGFGCTNALPAALSHGACVVLQESFDAGEALALMEREKCSILYGTPNMIQALCEHPDRAGRDLSSLRSGATLGTPEQLKRAVALGATQICNVYGLTEIYGNSHATSADDPLELRLISSGRPLPGVSQKIVDIESGLELPPGKVGEIRLKGRVTRGYLKDPEQTAAAFDDDGYFRTGDLGLVDTDGNLRFQGRLKELVKTGGINVSPAEIEAVLMTHPDVEFALVAGVPHESRDEVLGAVVILKDGRHPSEDDIRGYCKKQLAVYKVPSLIKFSTEAALPLTTTGKVQKNRLAQVFFNAPA